MHKQIFFSPKVFFCLFILASFLVTGACSKMQKKVSFYEMPCGEKNEDSCDFPEDKSPNGVYSLSSIEDVVHPEKTPLDVLMILENSKSMEKFNHTLALNLAQFVKCIEPLDWRLGILSSVWKKKGERVHMSNGDGVYDSLLMPMEVYGQISNKTWLNSSTYDYQKIVSDTFSLNSGCHLPPYCIKGKNKPLHSLNHFLSRYNNNANYSFLRSKTPLMTITMSLKDEQKFRFEDKTTAEQTLKAVVSHHAYSRDEFFLNLLVTSSGSAGDCIKTKKDYVYKGSRLAESIGVLYNIVNFNPIVFLITSTLKIVNYKMKQNKSVKENQVVKFALRSGGQVFDLCSPYFGRALAYSTLSALREKDKFPEQCKKVKAKKSKDGTLYVDIPPSLQSI